MIVIKHMCLMNPKIQKPSWTEPEPALGDSRSAGHTAGADSVTDRGGNPIGIGGRHSYSRMRNKYGL